jgi:hypothetical protein
MANLRICESLKTRFPRRLRSISLIEPQEPFTFRRRQIAAQGKGDETEVTVTFEGTFL